MKPYSITEDQFASEVLESKAAVLVDFWAPWCAPCKSLDSILSRIGEHKNGSLKIVKVDVMGAQSIANNYMIQTLPTTVLFKDGQVVSALTGLHSQRIYEEMLESV